MNIKEVSVARLKEYENNPRNNDLAVEKVKHSIERFGFFVPVIVDINYVIVAGHTRVRACKELGIQSVPCIVADELTEEQINFFRLVDNKSAEYSDWDFEKLKSELELIDLTLEENQLLLERFELSAEVFEIEAEQAEIRIPTFNFLSYERPVRKPVQTIKNTETDAAEADDDLPENADDEIVEKDEPTPSVKEDKTEIKENPRPVASEEATAEKPAPQERTQIPRAAVAIQFRFGDIAFYISQVELDKLNQRYAEYVDSGAMLECGFGDYLLKGLEI